MKYFCASTYSALKSLFTPIVGIRALDGPTFRGPACPDPANSQSYPTQTRPNEEPFCTGPDQARPDWCAWTQARTQIRERIIQIHRGKRYTERANSVSVTRSAWKTLVYMKTKRKVYFKLVKTIDITKTLKEKRIQGIWRFTSGSTHFGRRGHTVWKLRVVICSTPWPGISCLGCKKSLF